MVGSTLRHMPLIVIWIGTACVSNRGQDVRIKAASQTAVSRIARMSANPVIPGADGCKRIDRRGDASPRHAGAAGYSDARAAWYTVSPARAAVECPNHGQRCDAARRLLASWRASISSARRRGGVCPRAPPEYVRVDFFTDDTIWLQRFYILLFIESGSRRVRMAGCTANPNAPWIIQQVRQLSWTVAERSEPLRFLIRDRDQKFADRF